MTRAERRANLHGSIEALKRLQQTRERDLEIRLYSAECDLLDSYQIAEHYQFRNERLRAALLKSRPSEYGFNDDYSEKQIDALEADYRDEKALPVPVCKHCKKALA